MNRYLVIAAALTGSGSDTQRAEAPNNDKTPACRRHMVSTERLQLLLRDENIILPHRHCRHVAAPPCRLAPAGNSGGCQAPTRKRPSIIGGRPTAGINLRPGMGTRSGEAVDGGEEEEWPTVWEQAEAAPPVLDGLAAAAPPPRGGLQADRAAAGHPQRRRLRRAEAGWEAAAGAPPD